MAQIRLMQILGALISTESFTLKQTAREKSLAVFYLCVV